MEGAHDIPDGSVAPTADIETPLNPSNTDQFEDLTKSVDSNNQVESHGNEAVSLQSPSISDVEDGQILDTSSDCSDVIDDRERCSVKRSSSPSFDDDQATKKSKKRISFSAVTAYYFPRAQGFTCIPSQGGSTLGMALKHSHVESLSLSEHALQQRKNHRRLLLQMRKKRKTRNSKKDASDCTDSTALEIAEKTEARETESDESDEQQISDVSDSELDINNYYFLQPVTTRQRRALLRESGVTKIETSEKEDCRQIRVSRESCGCSCQVYCEPESCSCAQSGIQCQVDRLNFPCGCSRDACANPSGRVEFNPVRVRTHFIHTLMRLELENAEDSKPQLVHTADAMADMDTNLVSIAAPTAPDPHYNWENVMQPPQPNSSYSLTETSAALSGDHNNWYGHYPNEPSNYALYSGAPNSTQVFNYNAPAAAYCSELSESIQYTELVDNRQGYASEYYHDYNQMYNPFDHHSFSYDNSYSSCTEEAYGYTESGSVAALNGSNTVEGQAAPKMESLTSSSSSSEEDTLEIGSSLATIVKETMVSV